MVIREIKFIANQWFIYGKKTQTTVKDQGRIFFINSLSIIEYKKPHRARVEWALVQ